MSGKYKDSEVIVRPARREDMAAVAEMIQELADFEKFPEGPKLSVQDLERDCFDVSPVAFRCLVAELAPAPGDLATGTPATGALAGYAVFFPTYSTWEGRALMLRNLSVRRAQRRRGIGERLFYAVAKEAAATGTCLEFFVLEWNPARAFYEALGARSLTRAEQWCYYPVAGDALAKLAAPQ